MDAGIHILTLDMAQTKELWMLEYTFLPWIWHKQRNYGCWNTHSNLGYGTNKGTMDAGIHILTLDMHKQRNWMLEYT